MGDLISRQDAIRLAEQGQIQGFEWQFKKLCELPSPEPERKRGKWTIKNGELAFWDVCSECKKMVIHKAPFYNYCPNCGADMRQTEEE